MDFKGATRLFLDPNFDGDPVSVYDPKPKDPPAPPEGGDDGGDGPVDPPPPGSRPKFHVADVPVSVLRERTQVLGPDLQLNTESIKDYTRKTVRQKFALFDDFLKFWSKAEQKRIIIQEMQEQGVQLGSLEEIVGRDFDPFDLICHVAYDEPPLTRKQRAAKVRQNNYFNRYGAKAREVMEALLDKYADQGIEAIESPEVFKVAPFTRLGTSVEIIQSFGGRNQFVAALRDLKAHLYFSN